MAGALLAGACSGTSTEATATTAAPTTATTAAPAPTTTAAPATTTTTATTEPPVTTTTIDPLARPDVLVSNMNRDSIGDFDTVGDDLYRVAVELFDLFNYLEGNPAGTAEDMLSTFMEPDYPHWQSIRASFLELEENRGWHYIDAGIQILAVEVEEARDTVAVVRVADARGEQIIADASNTTVRTYEGWDREVTSFTFIRGSDGRWRFADLEPSELITDDQLSQMVPVDWTERTS
jgi:hypothetical protein